MGNKQSRTPTPRISPEQLEYLLKTTNITSKEIKHWYRIYMTECPSGQLSKEQFCKIYAEIAPHKNQNAIQEHIFRTYDQDNSGHIDFNEFIEAINVTRSSKPEDKLRMAFRLYDIDQNGCIEEREMAEVMRALHAMTSRDGSSTAVEEKIKARAKRVFDRVDKNHDGQVTVDELVNVCMRDPEIYNMVISSTKTSGKKGS
ncbi:neuronal calcium sensor 2-like [Watersipora subatra]|uniref:neuronal calcium sensor 2-like n=1 Tax=Watersipora subatra TaxID=2589382 RepID=UPI00355C19D0